MQDVKFSIKKQYAIVFGVLFASLVLLMYIVNAVALGRVYESHKKRTLISVFNRFDNVASQDGFNEDFEDEMRRLASMYNLDIVMINPDMEPVIITDSDAGRVMRHILDFVFKGVDESKVLIKRDNFEIISVRDDIMDLEYIELWGTLSNGYFISLRTPFESIRESAHIANQLTLIVGSVCILICVIIIRIVTRKITMPIMNLVQISERMTQLDFREKYVTKRKKETEVDVLGDHINMLSNALEVTISDLKSANVQLQHDINAKIDAEEKQREFVTNVSHELKTPIALIQGYAEGLKDCVNDDEESREYYCDVIIDEAQRMNKLVKSLLELDQIESGIQETVTDHFDIVEVIYNCASNMEILCKQKGVELILPERTAIMVWADEFKIEQIISNYLSNALNHVSGDMVVRVSAEIKDQVVRVKVFNTGNPIPEESLEHLWEKFYKVDKARTREYGGSGIGLSIVRAIMESMGRDYGVENYDNGVEFWFEADASTTLPATEVQTAAEI